MVMSPLVQGFVMHFGEMGSRWGINRTVGQIYALLVASDESLCADNIADALKISRGNVSMGLKELQAWRLIKQSPIPGDRKDYFTAAGDFWYMARRVLEERQRREVDPTLTVLRDLLLEDPSSQQDEFAQRKMRELHDLLEQFAHWSQELQGMKPDNLKRLMKLGAGVGKVLELKDGLRKTTIPNNE